LLGIVENMSTHICTNCGHEENIFGAGGGDAIADDYDTAVIARLPLAMSIRVQSDGGKPSVLSEPEGAISEIFKGIARDVHSMIDSIQPKAPQIKIVDD
ncbi:MAG: P-loop NTPase, partial [Pseudomonadales bacterium]|nr:P-loop NTPase [Pseudomonadales bacterium]